MEAAADPAAALQAFEPPAAAREAWESLTALMRALHGRTDAWPDELSTVRRWYEPHLARLHGDEAAVRALDLVQLQHIASGHASRERFLTELTLDPPQATSDEAGPPHQDEDYLILSTIHSAKGQEWPAVTVLNVVDGCIPADISAGSSAQLEEERRLLYVAMTRARNHLSLMVPLRFHVTQQARHGDRHLYGGLSRFIPPEVAALFERVGPAAGDGSLASRAARAPRVDVRGRLGSAWD
jgi:DNA helicase-2/ATP-dependent DNA helicase PcrA